MTARAKVSQADLKRMATVAKSENVTVEIEVDGRKIRVVPVIPDNNSPAAVAKDEIVPL